MNESDQFPIVYSHEGFDDYYSIGCNFRELLLSVDLSTAMAKAALRDYDGRGKFDDDLGIDYVASQMKGYLRGITEVLTNEEFSGKPMAFVLRFAAADELSDEDWINVGLFNYDFIGNPPDGSNWKEYEKDEHNRVFSSTFAEWSEHADREVLLDAGAIQFCQTLEDIVAELIWEMTFSGFSGKAVAETADSVLGEAVSLRDEYYKQQEKE